MPRTVRTAVSLRSTLFHETEALAARLRLSRSALFARALEEFVRRQQNRELLDKLNAVYDEGPDRSERAVQEGMLRLQRGLLKGKG
ncbi:MAG: hypothetical protein ACKV22_12495 [Bryobacteraceae bacterium]